MTQPKPLLQRYRHPFLHERGLDRNFFFVLFKAFKMALNCVQRHFFCFFKISPIGNKSRQGGNRYLISAPMNGLIYHRKRIFVCGNFSFFHVYILARQKTFSKPITASMVSNFLGLSRRYELPPHFLHGLRSF